MIPVMYQADQIQSMINELDRILRRTGRWRLWNFFIQLHDQYQMLERVRTFLLMQQRSARIPELAPIAPPALMRPLPPPHLHLNSVKLEVAALIAQRDTLREEVKFLSAIAQTTDPKTPPSSLTSAPTLTSELTLAPDTRQVEQLSALHDRTDFLLSSMDSSLQMAFTSMQKNVEVYQTTLHQGLDRMHNLGYQGEVLLSALINHLAQQMGRELAANPANPTGNPTGNPTSNPTANLTANPTTNPTNHPTSNPTINPTINPETNSTSNPTATLPETIEESKTRPSDARSQRQTPMDLLSPETVRSTPKTELSPSPQPETAVRFSPETTLVDREMTLDTLFGNPFDEASSKMSSEISSEISNDIFSDTFGNAFGDTLGDFGGGSFDSGLDSAHLDSEVNDGITDDITLEEMNALFADIPSLKSQI